MQKTFFLSLLFYFCLPKASFSHTFKRIINEQIVNEIYLYVENNEIDTLNTSQIAQLESIIYQCPMAGGTAVYRARALYMLYKDAMVYDDENVCAQAGLNWRQAHTLKNGAKNLSVYPNPAANEITLQYNNSLQNATVNIYNTSGILVHKMILPKDSYQVKVNVNHLSVGVYYARVGIETTKFVIIR